MRKFFKNPQEFEICQIGFDKEIGIIQNERVEFWRTLGGKQFHV